MADRSAVVEKVQEIAQRVASSEGLEIVDVRLLGGGSSRLLRIFIDKPEGVTHADCEFISQNVGTILDVEDVIPGGRYTLEVSSPGLERKLQRPQEFERFQGHKIKVVLREAVEGQKHWAGVLKGFAGGIITLEPVPQGRAQGRRGTGSAQERGAPEPGANDPRQAESTRSGLGGPDPKKTVQFPLDQVERANLKFEW